MLTSLKSLLRDAQRRGNVAQNVARDVSIGIDMRGKGKLKVGVDIPTADEVQSHPRRRVGAPAAAADHGGLHRAAASELRGLRGTTSSEAWRVHVRQRADRYNVIGRPKSHAGERTVPIGPMVANTLREWRLACPKGDLGLVFPTARGR